MTSVVPPLASTLIVTSQSLTPRISHRSANFLPIYSSNTQSSQLFFPHSRGWILKDVLFESVRSTHLMPAFFSAVALRSTTTTTTCFFCRMYLYVVMMSSVSSSIPFTLSFVTLAIRSYNRYPAFCLSDSRSKQAIDIIQFQTLAMG